MLFVYNPLWNDFIDTHLCVCVYYLHIVRFGFERPVTEDLRLLWETSFLCSYHICPGAYIPAKHILSWTQILRALRVWKAFIRHVRGSRVKEDAFPVRHIIVVHHCKAEDRRRQYIQYDYMMKYTRNALN